MAKLVNCKVCGEKIAKSAETCPHCGVRRKKKGMGCFGSFLLAFLLFFAMWAAISGAADNLNSADNTDDTHEGDLFYSESLGMLETAAEPKTVVGQYGNITIDGSAVNISGKDLSYVQITFSLFDSDGAQIGSAVANINNLASGATWKYSAVPLTMDNFSTFELSDISGW